jgi:hypothetical protein
MNITIPKDLINELQGPIGKNRFVDQKQLIRAIGEHGPISIGSLGIVLVVLLGKTVNIIDE